MFKLAIFDLDGTLVNSIEDLANAANKALKECGFPTHSLEKYYYFVGNGVKNLIERALPENSKSEENFVKVQTLFAENYAKDYITKTYIYDGILELLQEFKKLEIKLAVASNKPDDFTKKIINEIFPNGLFDLVRGNTKGVPHKPHPQIVENIMSQISIDKKDCIFIGDTNIDIQTGKNAGLKTCGCLWGFREIEELQNAGADFIVSHPLEILKHINFK